VCVLQEGSYVVRTVICRTFMCLLAFVYYYIYILMDVEV
jgi:hypothetical protein